MGTIKVVLLRLEEGRMLAEGRLLMPEGVPMLDMPVLATVGLTLADGRLEVPTAMPDDTPLPYALAEPEDKERGKEDEDTVSELLEARCCFA